MKKLILIIILTINCSIAWAEWNITVVSDNGIYYHDKATIKMNGNIVKMWSMISLSQPSKLVDFNYLSIKSYIKYNCTDETTSKYSLVFTSEKNGGGKVLFSDTYEDKWVPVVPESIEATEFKIACKK